MMDGDDDDMIWRMVMDGDDMKEGDDDQRWALFFLCRFS